MFFRGFNKTATFGHNNQGLEFKMSDQGLPNVGPGGMAPSGVETYQPAPAQPKKTKADAIAAVRKMYSVQKQAGAVSDTANTVSSQLKWTFGHGDTPEDEATKRKEEKNKYGRYLKARLR